MFWCLNLTLDPFTTMQLCPQMQQLTSHETIVPVL